MTLAELKTRLVGIKSITEFAEQAGVHRATVRRVREGLHQPNMKTFEKLCAAVKVANRRQRRSI